MSSGVKFRWHGMELNCFQSTVIFRSHLIFRRKLTTAGCFNDRTRIILDFILSNVKSNKKHGRFSFLFLANAFLASYTVEMGNKQQAILWHPSRPLCYQYWQEHGSLFLPPCFRVLFFPGLERRSVIIRERVKPQRLASADLLQPCQIGGSHNHIIHTTSGFSLKMRLPLNYSTCTHMHACVQNAELRLSTTHS